MKCKICNKTIIPEDELVVCDHQGNAVHISCCKDSCSQHGDLCFHGLGVYKKKSHRHGNIKEKYAMCLYNVYAPFYEKFVIADSSDKSFIVKILEGVDSNDILNYKECETDPNMFEDFEKAKDHNIAIINKKLENIDNKIKKSDKKIKENNTIKIEQKFLKDMKKLLSGAFTIKKLSNLIKRYKDKLDKATE